MPDQKNVLKTSDPGAIRDMVLRLRLVWNLMLDKRVDFWLKIIPLGALAYLVWPMDAIPGVALPVIGALDDAAVLWLGASVFVELCPPDVVAEHKRQLGLLPPDENSVEVIDADVRDIDD